MLGRQVCCMRTTNNLLTASNFEYFLSVKLVFLLLDFKKVTELFHIQTNSLILSEAHKLTLTLSLFLSQTHIIYIYRTLSHTQARLRSITYSLSLSLSLRHAHWHKLSLSLSPCFTQFTFFAKMPEPKYAMDILNGIAGPMDKLSRYGF